MFFFLVGSFCLLLFLLFPRNGIQTALQMFICHLCRMDLLCQYLDLAFEFFLHHRRIADIFPDCIDLFVHFRDAFAQTVIFLADLFPCIRAFFQLFICNFEFFLYFTLLGCDSLCFHEKHVDIIIFQLILLF